MLTLFLFCTVCLIKYNAKKALAKARLVFKSLLFMFLLLLLNFTLVGRISYIFVAIEADYGEIGLKSIIKEAQP